MNQMAKKKLTKSQQLKKQNKRAARKRKKQRLVMVAQKKIEAKQKLLEADKKAVIEFSELIIAEMLKDKCLKIVEQEDGGLNTSGDFIELMFSYIYSKFIIQSVFCIFYININICIVYTRFYHLYPFHIV